MKNVIRLFTAYILLVSFILFNFSGTAYAVLTDGANAIDGLGQISGGVMVYTTSVSGFASDQFNFPFDVDVDEVNNRLFVLDRSNNRVVVYNMDSNHTFSGTDRAGDNVLGQPNFVTNTPGTSVDKLNLPVGLAFDPDDNRLFVADSSNHRISVFDTSTITDGESAVYLLGLTSVPGKLQNRLNSPYHVAYDTSTDQLYVADYNNNRVMVFDASVARFTGSGSSYNASYVIGQSVFTTSISGTTSSSFDGPVQLAIDSSTSQLFVSDYANSRVMIFDVSSISNGMSAQHVLGQTSFTTSSTGLSASKFNHTRDLSFDNPSQRLFVSDFLNSRVLVFSLSVTSDGEDAINVLGQSDFVTSTTTNTTGKTQNKFRYPMGLDFEDEFDQLFVTDVQNNRILIFDASVPPSVVVPEFSLLMYFVVVLVLGFAVVQKNGGLKELRLNG